MAQLKLDKLNTENGLPSNDIVRMLQDSYGYMWVSTARGVVRYNGYATTVYRLPSSKDKHNSVSIGSLFLDRSGNLWAGSYLGGIYKYDRVTDKFVQYTHDEHDPHSLRYTNIMETYHGNGNDVWVLSFFRAEANHTQAISLFDAKINGFINYGYAQKGKYHLDDKVINSLFTDHSGTTWILTATGIFRFNRPAMKFEKVAFAGADFKNYYNISQAPTDKNTLWLTGYPVGLLKLNIANKSFKVFRHSATAGSLPNDTVRAFIVDKRERIWVGTTDGLSLFNPQTGDFKQYALPVVNSPRVKAAIERYKYDGDNTIWFVDGRVFTSFNTLSLKFKSYRFDDDIKLDAFITRIMTDRTNTPWLSFMESGAARVNFLRTAFNYHSINKVGSTQHYIEGLLGKSDSSCYVATNSGLYTYNFNDGVYKVVDAVKGLPGDNFVMTVARNKDSLMALGTQNGFTIYDPHKNSIKIYKNDPHNPKSFQGEDARTIVADRAGNFWLGTGDKGVTLFNPKTGVLRPFPFNNDVTTANINAKWLDEKSVDLLYADKSGTIWAATFNGGLKRFNPKDSSFTSFYKKNPDISGINAIYEDGKHLFWVGTELNGLFLFNRETGKAVKHFSGANGLLSDEVNDITEDKDGHLWLTSTLGLSMLNQETNKITNFTKANALPVNDIRTFLNISGGRILGCTSDGITAFNVDDLKGDGYPPQVHIETLFHNNPSSSTTKTDTLVTQTVKKATLPYNQNQVTFNFVALHYSNPAQNQYRYQLAGFDKKWVTTKTQRSVTYNNLTPGTYTFKVIAANSDGLWNTKGDVFVLTITSPLWFRWWAWIIYIIVFVMAARAWLAYRSRKLIETNERLEQKIEQRTSELSLANTELNEQREEITTQRDQLVDTVANLKTTQQQLIQAEKMASLGELTAGIAHEIQNPLNFVNNFSEVSIELLAELKEEVAAGNNEDILAIAGDLTQNLEKINHHGKRADSIVKGMLEHSRASTGQKEPTNLNQLADEYLRLAYHGLRAKDKTFNAELVTNYDKSLPPVNIIPQDFGRVLLNMFNNAFYAVQQKKTIAGPDYKPTVEVRTFTPASGGWGTSVKDNGTGIPDDVKEKIMQPFFTTKPTGQGTGLGLSLSYDIIVKGHGGEIEINSTPGESAEFVILLPKV